MRAISVPLLVVLTSISVHGTEALPAPEILRFISSAKEVYVFPYTISDHPIMNRQRLRLLDRSARDALKQLLGDSRNWFDGFTNEADVVGSRAVGVMFRTGQEELVLFFDTEAIFGTFRGQSYSGGLAERRPVQKLYDWKKRYARLELEGK